VLQKLFYYNYLANIIYNFLNPSHWKSPPPIYFGKQDRLVGACIEYLNSFLFIFQVPPFTFPLLIEHKADTKQLILAKKITFVF